MGTDNFLGKKNAEGNLQWTVTPSRGGGGVVKLLINFATLDIKKYGCRLLMSTEQRKNSESP